MASAYLAGKAEHGTEKVVRSIVPQDNTQIKMENAYVLLLSTGTGIDAYPV